MTNGYFSKVKITRAIGGNQDLTFDFIHRTLEEYVNTFTAAGFVLDKIREPIIADNFLKNNPKFKDRADIPMRLNIRFRKTI